MCSQKDGDDMTGDHMSNSRYFAKENKLQKETLNVNRV
jgi:hypothetical protein